MHMTQADQPDITQILLEWRSGESAALERLLPAIYPELHRQAERAMRRENEGHTLQPTDLVHEAYMRLVDQRRVEWKNRAHFFGIAAQVMRRVLVDHARARLADKRGGGAQQVTLAGVDADQSRNADVDVLALNDALERLAQFDPHQAKLVELRYFAGMTIEETAEALGSSAATVKREWALARAWLHRELGDA